MNGKKAFTIIELLIALTLSSFIMLGMIQAYRNLMGSLERSRIIINANRNVCVLFNQMERDFSQAFVSALSKEPKKEDKAAGTKDKAKEEKPKEKEKKQGDEKEEEEKEYVPLKDFFIATVDDNEITRIDRRRFDLFKSINFITTSTLQVWKQKRIRLVRVMYEMVKDKEKSKGETVCYKLYRRETSDLPNVKMKEDEFAPAEKKALSVRTYLVAENIKNFYIEYIMPEVPEDQKENASREFKELRFFTWGNKKETTGILPQRAEVRISFWNDSLSEAKTYQATFPFYLFTTRKEKEDKKEKKEKGDKKNGGKSEDLETKKANLEKQLQLGAAQLPTTPTEPAVAGGT